MMFHLQRNYARLLHAYANSLNWSDINEPRCDKIHSKLVYLSEFLPILDYAV